MYEFYSLGTLFPCLKLTLVSQGLKWFLSGNIFYLNRSSKRPPEYDSEDETFTHMAGGLVISGLPELSPVLFSPMALPLHSFHLAQLQKKAVKINLYTGSGARHLILSKMFTDTSGPCPQVLAIWSCQKMSTLKKPSLDSNIPKYVFLLWVSQINS